jgi:hypothetical protein
LLSVVGNSRDSQTIVCHLPAEELRSDFFVSVLDLGLPQFPVGGGRISETGHLGTKDGFTGLWECMCRQVLGDSGEADLGELNDRDGGCVAFVLDILFLWALCNITPNIALGRAVSL